MNMNRMLKYLRIAPLATMLAACDEGAEFYTALYPVERVEIRLENGTLSDEGQTKTTPEEEALLETIRAEIMAASPVEAGGSYTLHFTQYDGGGLEVIAAPGSAPMTGSFQKTPGARTLRLVYGEGVWDYETDSYLVGNISKTVLRLDLTAECQARHPEAGITRAVRMEYTTANYY